MQIVTVLDMIRLEAFLPSLSGVPGRPMSERVSLGRAFVAKAVLNLPTTAALIERLQSDKTLRRLCGWERMNPPVRRPFPARLLSLLRVACRTGFMKR